MEFGVVNVIHSAAVVRCMVDGGKRCRRGHSLLRRRSSVCGPARLAFLREFSSSSLSKHDEKALAQSRSLRNTTQQKERIAPYYAVVQSEFTRVPSPS